MSKAQRDISQLLDLTTSFTPDDLILDGTSSEARLGAALLDASVERSMEGATTLTLQVADDDWSLLADDELFGAKRLRSDLELEVGDITFVLGELEKADSGFELVFYDDPTIRLQEHFRRMKASRDAQTRAQFFGTLCKAAGVRLYSVDKDVRQPIAALDRTTANAVAKSPVRKARERKSAQTVSVDGKLTVNGGTMTSSQRTNCGKVLAAARKYGATGKPLKALICAAIVENAFSNSGVANDHASVGIFQAQPGISQGLRPGSTITRAQALDIDYQVAVFLQSGFWVHGGAIAIAKAHPEKTAGQIAYWVEGCAAEYAYRYDAAGPEADKILAAAGGFTSASGPSASETRTVVATYEFSVDEDESYLAAGQRLADEVRWRCFSVGTGYVFDSDLALARADPSVTLREGDDGVERIRWVWTRRKRIDEVSVDMRAVPWIAPPGSVAKVVGEGAASGDYLVRSITSSLFGEDRTANATLGRPQRPLKEPAPETETITSTRNQAGSSSSASEGGANGRRGSVTISPNANLPGRGMQRPVLDFLGLMAGLMGTPVGVTTGTNHDQYTTNGNTSDHYAGNAADLGIGGDIRLGEGSAHKGNVYASAALQVCGFSKKEADRMALSGQGLDFSRHFSWAGHDRIQIGWRTEVGGNHWNHVHVGVP